MAQGDVGSTLTPPSLAMGLRINLSIMMFLQFAIWGAWYVILGNYTSAMGFHGNDIGLLYSTVPLGAMLSPIFIGQIADRYFSSETLMGILHLIGAGLLLWMATITDANMFFWAALAYALAYSPTLALSNSISFTHLPDATRDFPGVRVLGTIGWIAVGLGLTPLLSMFAGSAAVQGMPAADYSVLLFGTRYTFPLLLAAGLSLVLGVTSFFLPHTPPLGKPGDSLPFLRAIGLMKEFSFAVFYGISFVITIVLAFYYSFTGVFLELDQGVAQANVSSIMTIGQFAEMILLPLLPFFLIRFGMKWVLAFGMLAWGVRYGIFALGEPYALILFGIALHGICFDFFFAAGFIHVDNKAPREIRASGQALFAFLTYGAGMFIGSWLSGVLKEQMTNEETKVTDWQTYWLVPCIGVMISFVLFVLLFRDTPPIKEPEQAVDPKPEGIVPETGPATA